MKNVIYVMIKIADGRYWNCPICNASHQDPECILSTCCENGHRIVLTHILDDRGLRESYYIRHIREKTTKMKSELKRIIKNKQPPE